MTPVGRWLRALLPAAVVVVGLTVGLSACSSDGAGPKPTDPALAVGWQAYADHCATCHGGTGGGGSGPKLAGTVEHTFPNIADQIAVIENGKNGGMPAWKGTLSATQIQDVARYERQCLGRPSC
jgi:cytochrome c oxidase cbb3-type subunit III